MLASPPGIRAAIALALACISGAAIAADPAESPASERYERAWARCMTIVSASDRESCLRDAGTARPAVRQGRTETTPEEPTPAELARNRLRRCEVHPTQADREECIRRMQSGVTTGSVEGGGVLRELRTIEMQ